MFLELPVLAKVSALTSFVVTLRGDHPVDAAFHAVIRDIGKFGDSGLASNYFESSALGRQKQLSISSFLGALRLRSR